MDRLIYIAMTGAKNALQQQARTANNLANVATPGFRADVPFSVAFPVGNEAISIRQFVAASDTQSNLATGPLQQTGRLFDLAIAGEGWFSVQTPEGEAYTRNGSFELSPNGVLMTQQGYPLLGDGGPLSLPPDTNFTLAGDGTLSGVSTANPANVTTIGRLKLTNPAAGELHKTEDGLFRLKNGKPAETDSTVKIQSGALEGSNVNMVESLVSMIGYARQFDLHMRLLQTAETNARQAGQLINFS